MKTEYGGAVLGYQYVCPDCGEYVAHGTLCSYWRSEAQKLRYYFGQPHPDDTWRPDQLSNESPRL
jgi:hypothetical protein